jgi:hypothetical protein
MSLDGAANGTSRSFERKWFLGVPVIIGLIFVTTVYFFEGETAMVLPQDVAFKNESITVKSDKNSSENSATGAPQQHDQDDQQNLVPFNNKTVLQQEAMSTTTDQEQLYKKTVDSTWCPFANCQDSVLCLPCKKRYLFVVAVGRSGSTTMQSMLNMLPGVRLTGENDDAVNKIIDTVYDGILKRTMLDTGHDPVDHAWSHQPIRASDLACTVQDVMLALNPPARAIQENTALLKRNLDRTITGCKTIRLHKSSTHSAQQLVSRIQKHFPCSRVVVNFNSEVKKQAKSQVRLGWYTDLKEASVLIEADNAKVNKIADLFGSEQAFVMDTAVYSTNMTLALQKFNTMVDWLGFRGCTFPQLRHANNKKYGIDQTQFDLGPDCKYQGDWEAI